MPVVKKGFPQSQDAGVELSIYLDKSIQGTTAPWTLDARLGLDVMACPCEQWLSSPFRRSMSKDSSHASDGMGWDYVRRDTGQP
ncbi:hypothetical protein SCLCIDRAFT_1004203 [Scleroderma citrinum Foug A]|uniref:Uncharacterized protein n=1 Tax=Scleroderma citrinum Foug A TaxID=1036808 RepID=A0A0C3EJN6_9AGAM|nr:hypothetical protein SCLCIDRAFT_1004203 [Scleroderma citrinum Foug A]